MLKELLTYIAILLALTLFGTFGHLFLPELFSLFDIFFLAAFFVAMRKPPMTAQLFGLSAGLLLDVFSGSIIGLHAISLLVIGYLFATIHYAVIIRLLWHKVVALFAALLINVFTAEAVYYIFGVEHHLDLATTGAQILVSFVVGVIALRAFARYTTDSLNTTEYEKP